MSSSLCLSLYHDPPCPEPIRLYNTTIGSVGQWYNQVTIEVGGPIINSDDHAGLEYEVAVLVRLLTATRPHNARVALLDRSAYLIGYELLHCNNPCSMTELAERLQVDLSTISRQIAAMEAKGLIERKPDVSDPRTVRVTLSDHGLSQWQMMRQARQETYKAILADWSSEDRQVLSRLIHNLNQSIRTYQTGHRQPEN